MEGQEILFSETQKFKQKWVWALLIIINATLFFGVYKQIVLGERWIDKAMNNTGLIISTLVSIGVSIMFYLMRIETQIRKTGVYVRFFPFHFDFKEYTWDKLSKCYVRKYSAITEYGGWGWRISLFGRGIAYNVSGDKGIQLVLKNGRRLLIGTQKEKEAQQAIKGVRGQNNLDKE